MEAAINTFEATFEKYGDGVICTHGSVPYNKYVPASDHSQLLHQTVVVGSLYVVYITYNVKEGVGCIVYAVIYQETKHRFHINQLLEVSDRFLR